MIEFKNITLADKERVQKYTLPSHRKNCDLSFSNLCSWSFYYETQIAELDGFLLFRYYDQGILSYMFPVGEGDIRSVLSQLIEDAHLLKEPFCFRGVCSNARADLEAVMPESFTFESDRDYSDYVYLRSDLATLTGKKFQTKRNHLNKFRNTYSYEYLPFTSDKIQDCLELEHEWCLANHCDQNEGTGNERRAVIYALHHFESLGLSGGLLYVNGKIVAFTLGMPISHDTFGVHVEKADTSIEGAYAMINYEFSNQIPEQYIYLNREEDLGLEGLRRAKQSYQPTILLEKYTACLKEK